MLDINLIELMKQAKEAGFNPPDITALFNKEEERYEKEFEAKGEIR